MELTWSEVKGKKRTHELFANGQTIATITYPSIWKSDAHVTIADQSFVIRSEGWLGRIVARDAVTNDEIARVHQTVMSRSEIRFAKGEVFKVRTKGFWSMTWEFVAPDDTVILSIEPIKGWLRSQSKVVVHDAAAKYPEVRVLLPLAWHMRLAAQAAGAAAAATT